MPWQMGTRSSKPGAGVPATRRSSGVMSPASYSISTVTRRARHRPAADPGREGGTLEEKEDRVTQVAAFTGDSGLEH